MREGYARDRVRTAEPGNPARRGGRLSAEATAPSLGPSPPGRPAGPGHPARRTVRLDDAARADGDLPAPSSRRRRPAPTHYGCRGWAGGTGSPALGAGAGCGPRGGLEASAAPAIRCRRGSRRCGRPPSPGRPCCLHRALRRCARHCLGLAGCRGAGARPAPLRLARCFGDGPPWSTSAGRCGRPRRPAVGERRGRRWSPHPGPSSRGACMEEHEEFEQIPWSELTTRPPDGKRRLIYLVAGGLGALILVVLVARAFLSPSPADPVAPAITWPRPRPRTSSVAATATTAAAVSSPRRCSTGKPTSWRSRPRRGSGLPSPGPSGSSPTTSPPTWSRPGRPTCGPPCPGAPTSPRCPRTRPASLSYVEWARAFRVEEVAEGRFRVGVVFRSLGAPPDRGFYRLPVRAVEVTVAVSADGGSTVVDLPTPVALPAGPEAGGLVPGGGGGPAVGGSTPPWPPSPGGATSLGWWRPVGRGRLAGGAHPGRRGGQPLAGGGVRGGGRPQGG